MYIFMVLCIVQFAVTLNIPIKIIIHLKYEFLAQYSLFGSFCLHRRPEGGL